MRYKKEKSSREYVGIGIENLTEKKSESEYNLDFEWSRSMSWTRFC